jgi:virginiamycin A acetyltransferase
MIVKENDIHFYLKVDFEFLDYCLAYGLLSDLSGNGIRWKIGDVLKIRKNCKIEPNVCYSRGFNIFSCGSYSYSRSDLGPDVSVGRYTSIADNVVIPWPNHPLNSLSSSSFFYDRTFILSNSDNLEVEQLVDNKQKKHPSIGHDCWVGSNVIIMPGVTIANGAVVAAGSVVTKSVPAYAVVGGNPARILKYRFDEETISALQSLRWFEYDPKLLATLKTDCIDEFIKTFSVLKNEIKPKKFPSRNIYQDFHSTKGSIFAIWISPGETSDLPNDIKYNIKEWRNRHPRYDLKVYDLNECYSIIGDDLLGFSIKKIIESCRFIAMKSDVLRLAMLYKLGGAYTDLKNRPIDSFVDTLNPNRVTLCEHPPTEKRPDPQEYYCNQFISAPPCSELIKDILLEILKNIDGRNEKGGVFGISGGSVMLKIISRAINKGTPYDFDGLCYQETWGGKMIRTPASYNSEGHWSTLQKTESLYI